MAVLGVREHHVLGLPDSDLAGCHGDGARAIGLLLDEVQPDTILTFGPDGTTFHPDHIAVHRWVTEEWERAGRGCSLLYATTTVDHLARFGDLYEDWGIYMTAERPSGTRGEDLALHVHLDGDDLARKLAALRAMPTQTGDLLKVIEPAVYADLVAEEAFVDADPAPSDLAGS
jgi:LmbE family N-acetylglucosaminyl deacetylase